MDESRLASLRLDACTFLRGTPPIDRMRACQSGFTAAVKRAKTAAANKGDGDRGRNAETESEANAPTKSGRKLNVKKIPEARVRSNARWSHKRRAVCLLIQSLT